ncbi:MAG TPA: hypothetical protein VK498_09990, partial [Ferruginibacter sp.]|nr:hypothetical protein [Ferruginibacter sp.]
YTFRDGETAWLFAQLLRIFSKHLGINVFTIDPYQIGHENEEGIESGAFWFYRKLGFSPMLDDVAAIVANEEIKIAKNKNYRTPAKILKQIAKSHLIFGTKETGQWKDFHIQNILLDIQESMAENFDGNAARMRQKTSQWVCRALNVNINEWKQAETETFSNYALILYLIPGFPKWTIAEKELLVKIIQAKGSGSEALYLQLMQKHRRLREALIVLGKKKIV